MTLAPAVLTLLLAVLAHVGGLSDVAGAASVPSWLTVLTGGVLVGASFLFNSLLTDHEGIRAVNGLQALLPTSDGVRRVVVTILRFAGVAVLALVLAGSVLGDARPEANFAILVVWAGWWAGYAMSTYLVGNSWPSVNPWRTLASLLPASADRAYPERYGAWPSVVGLLALVWVEVVSPLASNAPALGAPASVRSVYAATSAPRAGIGTARTNGSARSIRCPGCSGCTAASPLFSGPRTDFGSGSRARNSPSTPPRKSRGRRRSSSHSSG